jgi:phosphate transport system substrate-binding protein
MKPLIYSLFALVLVYAGCSFSDPGSVKGAGATFPQPLYETMFAAYSAETGQKVNYHGIGSGGGIFRLQEKQIGFAASDIVVTPDMMPEGTELVHVPMALGAVAISYNLPADPQLKLSAELLAEIFLGKVKYWNDSRIKALNPDVILPNLRILVARRSDESGTSIIFSDYLGKVSDEWSETHGHTGILRRILGLGAASNAEMIELLEQTTGAIGYVSLTYALKHQMPVAVLQNSSGNYITPTLASVSAAAEGISATAATTYITNTSAPQGYPISSFTWLVLYKDLGYLANKKAAQDVKDLIIWMLNDGQSYGADLNYASLPEGMRKMGETALQSLTYKGKQL